MVHHIPYVTADRTVAYGVLVSALHLINDVADYPNDSQRHVAKWSGSFPHDHRGAPLEALRHGVLDERLENGLRLQYSFSQKPLGGADYPDYYAKMTAYIAMVEVEAQVVDPSAQARTYREVASVDDDPVFRYRDNATSRAGLGWINRRLALDVVAIVGVGGTGAYVLDLVAKSPVRRIELYDGALYAQHNAFRAPGATSPIELERGISKAAYFSEKYNAMRNDNVIAFPHVDEANVSELRRADFVFVCVDRGNSRRLIVEFLVSAGIPFVDVGLGVDVAEDSLGAQVRVTLATPDRHEHLARRLSYGDMGEDEVYRSNVQVADLNAFNAVLAVMRWKRYLGFYRDFEREHHSTYVSDGNLILNEEL